VSLINVDCSVAADVASCDGTDHIQTAGRIIATLDASATLSEHGPHPVADGRLAALFCLAMA
jgi:hypothetical protein